MRYSQYILLAILSSLLYFDNAATAAVNIVVTTDQYSDPLVIGFNPYWPSHGYAYYLYAWTLGPTNCTYGADSGPTPSGLYTAYVANPPFAPAIVCSYTIYVDGTVASQGKVFCKANPLGPDYQYSQPIRFFYNSPDPFCLPLTGPAHPNTLTNDPISYVNGEISLKQDDLLSGAAGGWGHTRTYSNSAVRTQGALDVHGPGWFVNQMPYAYAVWDYDQFWYDLEEDPYGTEEEEVVWLEANPLWYDAVVINLDGNSSKIFYPLDGENGVDQSHTTYVLKGDGEETLTSQSIDDVSYLVYRDAAGNQTWFSQIPAYGIPVLTEDGMPHSANGVFLAYIDTAGHATTATYNDDSQISQISKAITSSENEVFSYTYASAGQIASVQRNLVVSGVSTTVRQAIYDYYPTDSILSPAGTLERVSIEDGSGNILDRMYYRYYFGTEITDCYPNGLKYVVNPREYDLMVGAGIDPMTADDTEIAAYASHYFEYHPTYSTYETNEPNLSQWVTKHVIQNNVSDADGTYTYSYTYNTGSLNAPPFYWSLKTVEGLPDGNQTVVYSDYLGNLLLKGTYDTTSDTYSSLVAYKYDDSGREIQEIEGSAIESFTDGDSDLGFTLIASGGKVTNYTYDDSLGLPVPSDLQSSETETDASGTLIIPVSSTTYIPESHIISSNDWVDDATPSGATLSSTDGYGDHAWAWIGPDSSPAPYHGNLAHQSALASGMHQHYFYGATSPLTAASGDSFFTYVYLNPTNPPSEIMLQFFDGFAWEHRAYWGADDVASGTDGTVTRCNEGSLPATGGWVRLDIPASDVGVVGVAVSGIAFTTYDGQVTYDDSGLTHSGVDSIWVDDAVPAGSTFNGTYESWNWTGICPDPESGSLCHQEPLASGMHQHYFYGATTPWTIGTGTTISTYVYLDPIFTPTELMFQFYDGSGWEHRAYWGANDMAYGTNGTASRLYQGPLPASGQWVKLTISLNEIGSVGETISGMSYTLHDGQAWFDQTEVNTADAVTYLVASKTAYRDSSDTGALTTNYAYTCRPDSLSVASIITTLPAITTAEHGNGTNYTRTDIYDCYGRLTWTRDADGYLHYQQYDSSTGAVTEQIDDVNTSLTSYFTDLPTGWVTPSGGGLNIRTTSSVDLLGRMTSMIDPNGNVSYRTYDDPNHEMRTYSGWQTSSSTPLLPTSVVREDREHGYDEYLSMVATPDCTSGIPTGAESIASLRSLRREFYDAGKRPTHIDTYANLSGLTYTTSALMGTLGTDYYEQIQGYDARNNRSRIVNEAGTITRLIFNSSNQLVSTWVGTNDSPTSGVWSPTNNTGSSNMVDVEDRQYDIDGNLTLITAHPTGSPTDDRVTKQWFDFADRLIAWKSGVQSTESTGVGRILTMLTRDDRGLVTSTSEYAADNVTLSESGGAWSIPSETLLISYRTASFDELSQCYATTMFGVDPSTAAVSSTGLKTDAWFDGRGHLIKEQAPGGLVTKNQWDGDGRLTQSSSTDGGGDSTWSDAGNETGDTVLHQDLRSYDANGNVILVTGKDRFDSETTTGDLGNASTAPLARVSFQSAYYDAVNRLTACVDVGTNAGSAYTRPGSAPSRSSTVHVTSSTYNDAGLIATSTDPRNITTAFAYDARDNRTTVIEAYDASVDSGLPSGSNNRTTLTVYDGLGHPVSVTASMPTGTASQTTSFSYAATTTSGSIINSNDVLTMISFPDTTTGAASTSSTQHQVITYNGLGQRTSLTDRNGSIHAYAYDVMGRPLSDAITTLGSGVDGSIRLLTTTYNPQGHPFLITSMNAVTSGSVVNQVQRIYNDLGQMVTEYQAPAGSVNTETSPRVQWTFTDMSEGVDQSRVTNLTYPNGRVLDYNYASGVDSNISRISSLSDDAGSSSGMHLENYSYLGLQSIVMQHHPEPGFDYSLIKQGSESPGDAGDQYTGLDRFGQVVDCRWLTTSTGTAIDRFQYGYDNVGNVLYENNLISSSFSMLFGEIGTATQSVYDPLNRATSFARGTLSTSGSNTTTLGSPYISPILDTVSTVNHPSSSHPVSGEQSWTFDQLGNWSSVATDGTTDTRTDNAQNQVTVTSDYSSIGYDNNGNLTSQTGESTNVFDAWNRGVSIRGSTFTYDALGRRVTESDSTDSQYFYYAGQQMIENAPQSGATVRHQQFVYGVDYIDHVILRDRDADNASDTGSLGGEGSGLEERLYYTHNRQFSVTGLVSQTGTVVERTIYDPYGESQYFSASFASPTATSSYANNVCFTGRWVDPTGELYFRARYYDPELGRFISQDPLMYIDGMSMYCAYFVPNNMDPTGMDITVTGTDGTVTVLKNAEDFKNFLMNASPGSIDSIVFRGHGGAWTQTFTTDEDPTLQNSGSVTMFAGWLTLQYLDSNKKVHNDHLNDLLKGKFHTAGGARIVYDGCDTGEGDDNLAKQTSVQIPNVNTLGSNGHSYSFPHWIPFIGGSYLYNKQNDYWNGEKVPAMNMSPIPSR